MPQGQFIIYIIMCGRESDQVGRCNVENKLRAKNNGEKMNKRRREKKEKEIIKSCWDTSKAGLKGANNWYNM